MLSHIEFSLTENSLRTNSTKYNVEITFFNFHYIIIWGLGFGCLNVKKYSFKFDENKFLMMLFLVTIGHANEYPTMRYFGNPRHTQSIITSKILTEYF